MSKLGLSKVNGAAGPAASGSTVYDVTRPSAPAIAAGPAAPFTFDNPSFDTRSLLGNVVYRWEYRPGSTLYLVWTQSRSNELSYIGNLDFARDRSALFSTHPDNIFLVKVNYWLGR